VSAFGPENLGVFVCSHVFSQERPILLVVHNDDEWQFLCGGAHPENETPNVVGVGHLIRRDPTIEEVAHIPNGTEAERVSVVHSWVCDA
jgi:hypothetical protein